MSRNFLLVTLVLGILCAACVRDPSDAPCPTLAPGDLVVTEIRGDQSGEDTYGEWIELYNASGATLDLTGLVVKLQRIDGGASGSIIVRGEGITVEANSYFVLGHFTPGEEPAHVDYGYRLPCEDHSSGCSDSAFDDSIYNAGAIELFACDGVSIDRIIYRDLPNTGTLSLDGAIAPPRADANDDEQAWCVDDIDDGGTTELGIRGTPGEENLSCN